MKLWKNKLQPARDSQDESVDIITDLDALVSEDVAFRFQGKTYKIRPLSAGEAFIAWQNLAKLEDYKKKEGATYSDVLDFYSDLFGSVCPEITRDIVKEMTQTQCTALLHLVLDTITGKAFSESKKKLNTDQSASGQSTLHS